MKHEIAWANSNSVTSEGMTCGHCEKIVAPNQGYYGKGLGGVRYYIYICPFCTLPTFKTLNIQIPEITFGKTIDKLNDPDIKLLYSEARNCFKVGAYNSVAMVGRKIIMHLAIQKEAPENQTFEFYVNFLSEKNWVPPNGKEWVDKIRKSGNKVTHKIPLFDKEEAKQILKLTELLLTYMFEFSV